MQQCHRQTDNFHCNTAMENATHGTSLAYCKKQKCPTVTYGCIKSVKCLNLWRQPLSREVLHC